MEKCLLIVRWWDVKNTILPDPQSQNLCLYWIFGSIRFHFLMHRQRHFLNQLRLPFRFYTEKNRKKYTKQKRQITFLLLSLVFLPALHFLFVQISFLLQALPRHQNLYPSSFSSFYYFRSNQDLCIHTIKNLNIIYKKY